MNPSLIGIEINDNELSFAQFCGNTGKAILCELPENLMSDDRITDSESLAFFIREQIKAAGFGKHDCALVLPGNATFFRTVNMPIVSIEQIKLNLPYEFRDYIGGSGAEFNYDYELECFHESDEASSQTASMSLWAAAAQKNAVKEYSELLHGAGLKLRVALPREMALLRLVKYAKEHDVPLKKEFSIIDIEGDHIHVSVFNQERLAAFKIIDSGFSGIDTAIKEKYALTLPEAISWRNENRENILASEDCEAVYDRISIEVLKTFNFYRYEHPQSEIGDVYFCGSGASIKPLTDAVVHYINFTENDITQLLPMPFQSLPLARSCAIAIGMTL